LLRCPERRVEESKLKVADAKSPEKMRADAELSGTQKTRPSGKRTPPINEKEAGYTPVGVVRVSPVGS
jgi:hypothetical protein